METSFHLAMLLQSATDSSAFPIGRIEQISIVAFSTLVNWMLWKAYREKDNQLLDLTKQVIASDTQQLEVMRRVERLLESSKHFDAR